MIAFYSTERTGGGSAHWNLAWIYDADQNYGAISITNNYARFLNVTTLESVKFEGVVDLGDPEYFTLNDTTPSVVGNTIFYTWTCNDSFDAHCVDIYDSRIGSPCGGDYQCSGSTDGLCDYDAVSQTTDAPQRVGSGDNVCDSDALTVSPASAPSNITITDFDGGVDGQWIHVIIRDQQVTYACNGSSTLECGTADTLFTTDQTSSWIYNGIEAKWHLIGLETFSDAVKVGKQEDNTLTGNNIFSGNTTLGGVLKMCDGSWSNFGADSTPSVSGNVCFMDNQVNTYTAFDDGVPGQLILIYHEAVGSSTFDCTGTTLLCGGVDLVSSLGAMSLWVLHEDSTAWMMLAYNDNTELMLKRLSVTYENLSTNSDIGFGSTQVPQGDLVCQADGTNCADGGTTDCSHIFTTESASDIILCGKAASALTLTGVNCTALGSTTPSSQVIEVVECNSAGASCVGSGGTITATAVDTNYADVTFSDASIDNNDWWGIELSSFTTRADYLNCNVEFSRSTTAVECTHVFTTESATDVVMCGKADGALTLNSLNCTALGGSPDAQIVEIVECDSAGANCAGSGGTITVAAVDTNYADTTFTDDSIDDNDWWGIQLASYTTRADYLNCQVGYATP